MIDRSRFGIIYNHEGSGSIIIYCLQMFRRIFPTAARALPTIGKVSALTFAMLLLHRNRLIEALPFARPDARCFHVSFVPSNTIG